MKTAKTAKAISLSGTALALVLLLGAASSPVLAADDIPASSITMNAPEPPTAPLTLPTPAGPAQAGHAKNLSALEDKVSESVKNVAKQLSSVDNVSLDDLNSARQAIVKLEVLIDIEKHLAELEKVRSERGPEKSFAAAIPASALSAPPTMAAMASSASRTHVAAEAPAVSAPVHTDVTRVAGSDGHYTALIQGKFLQVGDSLPDGSTIVAISPKDVSAKAKDGAIRRLKVHGVDEIYGHSL